MIKKGFSIFIVFSFLLCSEKIMAAAPFISDDPDSLDKHTGELYLFSSYSKIQPDVYIGFPGVELDYGITDNLEFDAIATYLFNYPHVEEVPNTSGFGDTQLELKYRLVQETPNHPEVAFAPVYYFPAGNYNRNLGNGRPWLQLPFWLQKTWGDWTIYGGGGYSINSAPLTRNFVFGGLVLQKVINDKWTLGAEVYHYGSPYPNVRPYSLLNAGGYYQVNKNIQLLMSAGHSFMGQSVMIGYLGLLFAF